MKRQKRQTLTRKLRKRGWLFVLSGPSGSGKTTIAKRLLSSRALKGQLEKSVSLTTRPRRQGERPGRDYFFISADGFRKRRREKQLLEWTRYLNYYYATPRDFIDRQLSKGKNLLLCLDLKGVAAIRRLYPENSLAIFIMPPSLYALRQRISKRCQIKKGELTRRLRVAAGEIKANRSFDYCILNDNLKKAVKEAAVFIAHKIN